MYLGTFDNKQWFRVILLNKSDGIINLCDTGEISSLNDIQIAEIPENIANFPLQAVPASIYQYRSKPTTNSHEQIINEIYQTSDFLCLVKDFIDNRLDFTISNIL